MKAQNPRSHVSPGNTWLAPWHAQSSLPWWSQELLSVSSSFWTAPMTLSRYQWQTLIDFSLFFFLIFDWLDWSIVLEFKSIWERSDSDAVLILTRKHHSGEITLTYRYSFSYSACRSPSECSFVHISLLMHKLCKGNVTSTSFVKSQPRDHGCVDFEISSKFTFPVHTLNLNFLRDSVLQWARTL